jgi:hypothetical protein
MLLAVGIAWAFRSDYDNWPVIKSNTLLRFFVFAGALALFRFILLEPDTLRRRGAQLAVLTLLIGDTCLHFPKLNPTLPARVFAPHVVREHQQMPVVKPEDFYRVFITPKAENVLLMSTVPEFEPQFFGRRLALWSNLNLLDDVPKVNGSSTLPLKWQKELEDTIYKMTNTPPPPALLDFLGARYETATNSAVAWTPRKTALPLVTAGQWIHEEDDGDAVLKAVTSAEFDPLKDVWISDEYQIPPPPPPPPGYVAKVQAGIKAHISGLAVKRQEVIFQAEANTPTIAVIAQSWHPSWKATVNGQAATVLRANHAFQAVHLPKGNSEVRLYYDDFEFKKGCQISIAFLLAIIVAVFVLKPKVKRA